MFLESLIVKHCANCSSITAASCCLGRVSRIIDSKLLCVANHYYIIPFVNYPSNLFSALDYRKAKHTSVKLENNFKAKNQQIKKFSPFLTIIQCNIFNLKLNTACPNKIKVFNLKT